MTDAKKPTLEKPDFDRIADSIRTAADLARRLKQSGLNDRAIVILLQDATGCSQRDIKLIMSALPNLDRMYTKS